MTLPAALTPAAFDALHDDAPAWRGVIESLAAEHGGGPVRQMGEGTVLVALLGDDRVLKLYPPFLRDHFAFERAALPRLHGHLRVPTPRLLASGERDGWPYLVMSQLPGTVLTQRWATLPEPAKRSLLAALGALTAQVHALPVGDMATLAPPWPQFLRVQRERCHARQQRTGLPPHLIAQLDTFLQGERPEGPAVILTGEYTPMNLLVEDQGVDQGDGQGHLAGMFDFGDGLVGPREYDWLGPLCFLCAGHAERVAAFMGGVGVVLDEPLRLRLLRLLLLHRYSNLPAQLAMPGWQMAPGFEELAALIWPC